MKKSDDWRQVIIYEVEESRFWGCLESDRRTKVVICRKRFHYKISLFDRAVGWLWPILEKVPPSIPPVEIGDIIDVELVRNTRKEYNAEYFALRWSLVEKTEGEGASVTQEFALETTND